MDKLQIAYWIAVLVAGIYMLGIGYQFFPDPGKKDSTRSREHFDKFRGVFKLGGILSIFYIAISILLFSL